MTRCILAALLTLMTLPAAATLAGCSAPSDVQSAHAPHFVGIVPQSAGSLVLGAQHAPTSVAAAPFNLEEELHGIVREVRSKYSGQLGIAVTTKEGTVHVGARGAGPSWSTVKVPIAIAAMRTGHFEGQVDLAIKESDNPASYVLWKQVVYNSPDARVVVDKLLAEGESKITWPQTESSGNVPYGYTRWLLPDQSKFGAHLACLPKAEYVYDAMGDIVEWQQYGLTRLPHVHAKGGWGYDPELGWYTVRQFGTLEIEGGTIGLAMTSVQMDGAIHGETTAHETSVAALDDAAQKLAPLLSRAVEAGDLTPLDEC